MIIYQKTGHPNKGKGWYNPLDKGDPRAITHTSFRATIWGSLLEAVVTAHITYNSRENALFVRVGICFRVRNSSTGCGYWGLHENLKP